MKRSILAIACSLLIPNSYAAKSELIVYTYDSFISEWGSGPKLKTAFEKHCDCEVKFIGVEDGVSILNRLKIEGDKAKADVILGIDDGLMEETRATGLIAEHEQALEGLKKELNWQDKQFLPYDFGYFAFIYDSSKISTPVKSLKELINSKAKVLYQDPRTSTPGQGLMNWMNTVYGDETAQAWTALAQHTVTVTKGWWDAYSMFLKGGADYVLSYTTSPAYHVISESKTQYKAAEFSEGHVAQIELAAILKTSKQPVLAKQFLSFLISPEAQAIIPVTNWMLPVVDGIELPPVFGELVKPKPIGFTPSEISKRREDWIKTWRAAAAK
ncbi:thiamine ABC transporter substrate binding subunit [Thiolinea disciformis]|uniref:thiamine ABC transporter substrate binding subunit n=1 Tax=Thiolinea disciformis TaxID=125614 RepID=UPI0003727495|nr:thiamine ABC transporter substrate binding subunit [Thiolinea disciformis]